jgi:hypothetical protein
VRRLLSLLSFTFCLIVEVSDSHGSLLSFLDLLLLGFGQHLSDADSDGKYEHDGDSDRNEEDLWLRMKHWKMI